MATKLPYLPFYPADYLADTSHLTLKEHGAYLLLLFALWQRRGELVNDDSRLPKILGISKKEWDSIKDVIMPFFIIEDGLITHRRINYEIEKVQNKSEKAKESAGKRWGNDMPTHSERNANALRTQCSPDSYSNSDTGNTVNNNIKNNNIHPWQDVIGYLNQKTGKGFRPVKAHERTICARFNDGFTLDDFKKVIDFKTESWLNNPEMEQYLQPSTLFGSKFDGYLNAAKSKKQTNSGLSFAICKNKECGKPIYGSSSFCMACGTDLFPKENQKEF